MSLRSLGLPSSFSGTICGFCIVGAQQRRLSPLPPSAPLPPYGSPLIEHQNGKKDKKAGELKSNKNVGPDHHGAALSHNFSKYIIWGFPDVQWLQKSPHWKPYFSYSGQAWIDYLRPMMKGGGGRKVETDTWCLSTFTLSISPKSVKFNDKNILKYL